MAPEKHQPCTVGAGGGEGVSVVGVTIFNMALHLDSVADPDPHVFRPPGSGSGCQRYGSGSGSFYHHAKIVRKP